MPLGFVSGIFLGHFTVSYLSTTCSAIHDQLNTCCFPFQLSCEIGDQLNLQ